MQNDFYFLAKTIPCKIFQTISILTRLRSHEICALVFVSKPTKTITHKAFHCGGYCNKRCSVVYLRMCDVVTYRLLTIYKLSRTRTRT